MRALIVGHEGEVGSALYRIFSAAYPETVGVDRGPLPSLGAEEVGVMHVAIPYSDQFAQQVKRYQEYFNPAHTVVHSTVPVGTCTPLGAVHSPIRGLHPDLEGGVRTFVKFLGGPGASAVADHFRRAGMRVALFDRAETTEAMKLFDTEYYRACIEFAHRVKRYCDANSLSFHEVYTLANQTYNEGYAKLGYPEYVRPVLQPIAGPIGGHCVVPNSKLIND
jgi:hypothetical protein